VQETAFRFSLSETRADGSQAIFRGQVRNCKFS
jgi:hypothetical protein